MTGFVLGARWLVRAGSVPALGVAAVEYSGPFRNDAEQQPGRIAHYPPGVRLPYQLGAELLQPGYFGGWVVGVDVDMHPARPVIEPRISSHNSWPCSAAPWYSGCLSNWASGWPVAALQNASSRSWSTGGTSITILDSLL